MPMEPANIATLPTTAAVAPDGCFPCESVLVPSRTHGHESYPNSQHSDRYPSQAFITNMMCRPSCPARTQSSEPTHLAMRWGQPKLMSIASAWGATMLAAFTR